ncbi:hypothetical protein PscP89CL_22435, partial [Pseudomonas syringae]|nr:hypothetical protein [Pseudomonas syringae]
MRRKRTQSVRNGMRRRAPHDSEMIVPHAPAWEC